MNYFKPFLILFLVLLSGFNIQTSKPYLTQWVITTGCSLKVGGSTNVNKFKCVIAEYSKPDTFTFNRNNAAGFVKIDGCIKLDVQNFDCHHPVMTRDLQKTLKAKTFPKLIIRFISLNRYPRFNNQTDAISGVVTIELAGITKQYEVDYKFVSDGAQFLTLIGTRRVNFSDFNLIPPRKMGGMIQTFNELNVEFNLKMKVLD